MLKAAVFSIGNKVDRLGSSANIKVANNDEEHLGWKVHDCAQSFVLCSYTLHELYYVTTSLFCAGSRAKKEPKPWYNKEP